MSFQELNLHEQILHAISYMGFETPTPIQEKVIPHIIENHDIMACAQTGTGKTGAYILPILDKIIRKKSNYANALILVPTRELAVQIEQQVQGFSYFVSVGSIAIYGGGDGADWEQEKSALKKGTDIIIATPGRLLSHLKMGFVNFDHIRHLVLDEADRMLDMGFIDDIKTIISYLPSKRQTLMFSATMPNNIHLLAQKILVRPVEIFLSLSTPVEALDQKVFLIFNEQKVKLLQHLLTERKEYNSILIFTSAKREVSEIVTALYKYGIHASGISSDLDQEIREEVLGKFRAKRIRILVATNILSRGIDIKDINLVINYNLPHDAEEYVHRIGRTARVNTNGEALTLVIPKELHLLNKIERLIGYSIPRMEPGIDLGILPSWDTKESTKDPRQPSGKNKRHRPRGRTGHKVNSNRVIGKR
jgi:superfamily II DNA/RNA helicase